MAIDHSTSLPIFRDVVDDLREFVLAIDFIAEVAALISADTVVSPEVVRGRTLPINLLAEGLSRHLDVLERFEELVSPFRKDQEALALVIGAANEAGISPSEILRYAFEKPRPGAVDGCKRTSS